MRHYAGLDVSLEETAICVVDETGKVIRELRAASEPDALVETLAATGFTFERVGLEACSLSSWLHQGLTRAGLPALCIETRAAKAAMGTMPNKTDRNDARGLAQIIRTGWYRAVHVKSTGVPIGTRAARRSPYDAEQAARHRECRPRGASRGRAQAWDAIAQALRRSGPRTRVSRCCHLRHRRAAACGA